MVGVNKVILVGHLGKDPEMRYQQDGTALASFAIATSDEWKDKSTGEKKERTEWHRIVAWRRLGEICGEYLSKGSQVYIEGKLQTQQYEKDGITRYTTNIVASTVKFLGDGGNDGQRSSRGNHSQYDDGGYPEPPPMDRYEDDIPF